MSDTADLNAPQVTPPGPKSPEPASARAFGWIVVAYVVAFGAAWATVSIDTLPYIEGVLGRALAADVVATLVIFGFSRAFSNTSFYDAYWSVAPPLLLIYFLVALNAALDARVVLISVLVFAWAIRLTHNWARGWQGLEHVDWRYLDQQEKTGRFFWFVDLFGLHLFPTVLVFLGCISIYIAFEPGARALNPLDGLATLIGFSALWIEYQADNELRAFRLRAENSGKTLATGVWAWCRHPNYLGELGFWIALFVYACAATGSAELERSLWGPLAMLGLFVGISIPMIDKRLASREGFDEHKRTTFTLLPISHLVKKRT